MRMKAAPADILRICIDNDDAKILLSGYLPNPVDSTFLPLQGMRDGKGSGYAR